MGNGRPRKTAAIPVSQNEPGFDRQDIGGKRRENREVKHIAICAVGLPLLVRAKIGHAGFNLNDGHAPIATKTDEIGAVAIGQRKLANADDPVGEQHPHDATLNLARDLVHRHKIETAIRGRN